MIKSIFACICFMTIGLTANAQLVVSYSPHTPEASMQMLKEIVTQKGLTIFGEIDHDEQADQVNMQLHSIGIISFGDPKVGTILMQADPQVGIELPLKIMVWNKNGRTMIAYTNPESYATEYSLEGQEETLRKMHGLLESIVKAVVEN